MKLLLLTLLFLSAPGNAADAQVAEHKDEYSHTFSYTPPGDTVRRLLRFHMARNVATGTTGYNYNYLIFDSEPHGSAMPRRRLADEIPHYDTLLRAALRVMPADSFRHLDLAAPDGWSDVLQRQVEVFSTHPVWKKKNIRSTPEHHAYSLTREIMLEGHVYAPVEAWLAAYGYGIAEFHCSKIGYLGPKLLKGLGITYPPGGPFIPMPNEFGINLRRTATR